MTETIHGTIERVYHGSPNFSAGVLETDDGQTVRFAGRFCANAGDVIALVGSWKTDAKFGRQFAVTNVSYALPPTAEGLVQYLARHPAFTGIGEVTARRIVNYATSAERLDRMIREDVDELHRELRIPRAALDPLRAAWIANSAENEVRAYLASFGLTPHQSQTLLDRFGNAVVGVLRSDPYQLIKYLDGYGFKKVDKIARAMGTAKDHPGRIDAGLIYVVHDQISAGHTYINGPELLRKTNELLLLDTLDSHDLIRAAAQRLLDTNELVSSGPAVTTPYIMEAERQILDAFDRFAGDAPLITSHVRVEGLRAKQVDAYRCALSHRIITICGGAGTGKTFVLARLAQTFREAGLRIALCSPTGKAAKRIEESLRAQGLQLEAKTIHRLLGYDGHKFTRPSLSRAVPPSDDDDERDKGDESDDGFDVVVVDEVSMVDVPLMAELVRRIDFNRTRLVLVGDHNQLPPVGPGNVLRDVIDHRPIPTVVLNEVVRQAGVLKANSSAILTGTIMPTAVNDPAWTVVDAFSQPQQIQLYLRDLVLERIPTRLGLDPVRDVQIITPTHLGPLGTQAINELMQSLVHQSKALSGDKRKFLDGDKVIQTSNDYDLGVMNGTIGRVLGWERAAGSGGYWVEFDGTGSRFIEGEKIGRLQLAYALTAHKAQGSEFPCVVVLCHRSHYFADRNWLYTAVTRAAKHCIVLGDSWGLRNTVKKKHTVERRTFLRLWARERRGVSQPVEACA